MPTTDGGSYVFSRAQHSKRVEAESLNQISTQLANLQEISETAVLTATGAEYLMQETGHSNLGFRLQRSEPLVLTDEVDKVTFQLGRPSDAVSIFFLLKMASGSKTVLFRQLRPQSFVNRDFAEDSLTIFDLVASTIRVLSLRIDSSKPTAFATWESYVESFVFHLGFNLDTSIMPLRSLSELTRPSRIVNMRRSSIEELDAPHRSYIPDLVYSYQLGISAESPMLAFISFYHVLEHWFQHVFEDDLVVQVQDEITSPDFSYKRKKDINALIKRITRTVQLRDDQLTMNEATALRLTLEKYIDLAALKSSLHDFDPQLVTNLRESAVDFADGDKVNMDSNDASAIYGALAKRIYKTRNAVVHSKDGAKSKFLPYRHDKQLETEVPLLRFIAEQIIVRTSSKR